MEATSEPLIVDVIVQSWPETTGVIVRTEERVIGHYELLTTSETEEFGVEPGNPLFDLGASFTARRDAAVAALEDNQDYLRACFAVERPVCLRADDRPREQVLRVLADFGISTDEVAFPRLESFEQRLREMPLEDLFELLCRWHDVVELRAEAGTSAADPSSWVARAKPQNPHLFHYLAVEADRRHEPGSDAERAAYDLFLTLANPSLAEFTLGALLRWHYYHRAEFPGRELPRMRALAEARELARG